LAEMFSRFPPRNAPQNLSRQVPNGLLYQRITPGEAFDMSNSAHHFRRHFAKNISMVT